MAFTVLIALISAIPSILLLPFAGIDGLAMLGSMFTDVINEIIRNLVYIF